MGPTDMNPNQPGSSLTGNQKRLADSISFKFSILLLTKNVVKWMKSLFPQLEPQIDPTNTNPDQPGSSLTGNQKRPANSISFKFKIEKDKYNYSGLSDDNHPLLALPT